jgi:hypothetical protein
VSQCEATGATFGAQLTEADSRRVYGCAEQVEPIDACGEETINATRTKCREPHAVALVARGANCTFAYKV